MPARNPRKAKAQAKSPAHGVQNKRQRHVLCPSETPEIGDQCNNRDVQQNQTQSIDSNKTEPIRFLNWAVIVADVAEQPYPSQIQQYKEWRRAGSKREDYCCICHEPERLENCHTCKLAFHRECLPAGCARNSYDHLFCLICVRRGWDRAPPELTPPASPQPASIQIHDFPSHATNGTNSNALPISHLLCPAASLGLQREGLQTQSTLGELQPSAVYRDSSHDVIYPVPAGQTATESLQPTGRKRKSRHGALPGEVDASPAVQIATESPQGNRCGRKSWYNTLPSNVDASLSVIYQELESIAMLRGEIEELRIQNTQCAQTIKIQEQTQVALRRDLGTLQENATNSESTIKEISELRERNAALETELLVSKEETDAAKELKERLRAVLCNTIGLET
ncbi:hypothetical protein N7516_001438 [Penicillium verrucosum]|uniref:uncharacterized protein n=1 Tax=Penicillium verrucosum TaxID=60171 RepID=UPI0025458B8C|nr:uncharacterized protein N7516_001438 [Penicillium verrucosum]KAJ5941270.1 hypothetical protein N7516_001438 [Penicillium verrucosum]